MESKSRVFTSGSRDLARSMWALRARSSLRLKSGFARDGSTEEDAGTWTVYSAIAVRPWDFPSKCASISSSVLPFVSGRNQTAVIKKITVHPAKMKNIVE